MVQRTRSFRKSAPAFAVLALLSCSEADDGSDGLPDSGTVVGSSATDAPVYRDVVVIPGGTEADTAPVTPAADCLPFSPPIPCVKGTACPGDAYCDFKQSVPICTKLHCQANGTACPTDTTGNAYCMSGLCLSGICTSPVGEGASCATQACTTGLLCLGYPAVCVKPRPIGGACQDERWCANNPTVGAPSSSQVVYCLSGVCGTSTCNATGASSECRAGGTCDPGYSCVAGCAKLYCGQDGMPCSSDALCASGFGCVDGRCRKLNVPPHCVGTPTYTDCSPSVLFAIPGCSAAVKACSGTALDCASHTTAGDQACNAQVGCQWNYATSQCTGTPTACSELTSGRGCSKENGCTWSQTTPGSPTPCSQMSVANCATQFGCKVTDVGVY